MAESETEPAVEARRVVGLTIGEAARRLGLSVHTLRYYEGAGLLAGIGRRANGHRRYGDGDLHFLNILRCLRMTGMPIGEVRRFSALVQAGEATVGERLAMMREHRTAIEAQREILDRAAMLVDEKISHYQEMAEQGENAS